MSDQAEQLAATIVGKLFFLPSDQALQVAAVKAILEPVLTPNLYGETHLVCQNGEHVYPRYVPISCQCGSSKLVFESPEHKV